MSVKKVTSEDIIKEVAFSFSRSSGPGGQSVNKVNSKVELRFGITESICLTVEQKEHLLRKFGNKLTKEGVLVLTSQEARSQLANREIVVQKLDKLLEEAFKIVAKRKPSKPTKASKEKRLKNKKQQAEKKEGRRKL